MRLSALQPVLEEAGDGSLHLEFACPAHGVGSMRSGDPTATPPFEGWPDRVRVSIAVGSAVPHVWRWNGERDLEPLTLTPSINYAGHWHGHITDGEVTGV